MLNRKIPFDEETHISNHLCYFQASVQIHHRVLIPYLFPTQCNRPQYETLSQTLHRVLFCYSCSPCLATRGGRAWWAYRCLSSVQIHRHSVFLVPYHDSSLWWQNSSSMPSLLCPQDSVIFGGGLPWEIRCSMSPQLRMARWMHRRDLPCLISWARNWMGETDFVWHRGRFSKGMVMRLAMCTIPLSSLASLANATNHSHGQLIMVLLPCKIDFMIWFKAGFSVPNLPQPLHPRTWPNILFNHSCPSRLHIF